MRSAVGCLVDDGASFAAMHGRSCFVIPAVLRQPIRPEHQPIRLGPWPMGVAMCISDGMPTRPCRNILMLVISYSQ